MSTTSQAGIVSAIIGNILLNLALNLQKRAKLRLVRMALHGIHAPSRRDYHTLLAITLMVVGQFSTFVAYGLAPASIVSPLGVLAVISNCVIPPLLFDETPSLHNITGTTIALPGILILIMSAPYSEDDFVYPVEPESRLYLGSLCAISVASCLVRSITSNPGTLLHTDSLLSSLMGSFCVLSIKCVAAILNANRNDMGGLLLVLAIVIPTSAILQLTIIVKIVAKYPVWVVVPRLFVFLTVFVGLGSATVFHEFRESSLAERLEFLAGCLLVIIGVLISSKPHFQPGTGIIVKRPAALTGPKRHGKTRNRKRHPHNLTHAASKNHNNHHKNTNRHKNRRSLDKGYDQVYLAPHHHHHHHHKINGDLFEPFQYTSRVGSYKMSSMPLPPAMHTNIQFEPVSKSVPLHEREYLVPSRPRSQPQESSPNFPTETTMLLVPRRYSGDWEDEP